MLKNFLLLIVLLILLEIILRFGVGFGELPLYYTSMVYEYALEPGQDVSRFHTRFYVNNEGMRSDELLEGEWRIIKFGDSILNGGIGTDQDELASEILNDSLRIIFPSENVRVLNVSAGSWGVENAYLWMQEHGDFNAKVIVLVFSSHDYADFMSFENVVGQVDFYPKEQPFCATTDAFNWIKSRYFNSTDWNSLKSIKQVNYDEDNINPGWDLFVNYCSRNSIPLVVYHHADLNEYEAREYNEKGKALAKYLRKQHLIYIPDLTGKLNKEMYRDELHFNSSGQKYMAELIEPFLQNLIMENHE